GVDDPQDHGPQSPRRRPRDSGLESPEGAQRPEHRRRARRRLRPGDGEQRQGHPARPRPDRGRDRRPAYPSRARQPDPSPARGNCAAKPAARVLRDGRRQPARRRQLVGGRRSGQRRVPAPRLRGRLRRRRRHPARVRHRLPGPVAARPPRRVALNLRAAHRHTGRLRRHEPTGEGMAAGVPEPQLPECGRPVLQDADPSARELLDDAADVGDRLRLPVPRRHRGQDAARVVPPVLGRPGRQARSQGERHPVRHLVGM
ncbi:MAG: hypothetical protein AVDCRST_MAG68-2127, partial [uncultured Gemmatimonadetes bacterium]